MLNLEQLVDERFLLFLELLDLPALLRRFLQQFLRDPQLVLKCGSLVRELCVRLIHGVEAALQRGDATFQLGVRARVERGQEAANQAAQRLVPRQVLGLAALRGGLGRR